MIDLEKTMRFRSGNTGRNNRRSVLYTVLLLLMLFWPSAVLKGETYIFVGSNFPVLSEKSPDGTLQGIGIEIARIICKRLGHTPDIQLYPWNRAQAMVKLGMADVLIAPYKTPEREKWMDFSATPFFEDESCFFVRPDSQISWDGNLVGIRQYRIGMVPSWSVGPDFENAKKHLNIDYARNIDLCFQKLITRRVDMVPTQFREAIGAFHRLGLNEENWPVMLRPAISQHYNYFGFSRQNRIRLKKFKIDFEKILKQMHDSGEINKLLIEIYRRNAKRIPETRGL